MQRVLKQEIGFFDTGDALGGLMQGLDDDCIAIQIAIGDKLGMFVYFVSTFVCGIIIALANGWELTLVIISMLPLMFVGGFAVAYFFNKMSTKIDGAYNSANSLALQALSNVRIVYSFTAQEKTVLAYKEALNAPMKVGIQQGVISGSTLGLINCVAFCTYALALWYGGQKIIDGDYTGATVITVLFSAIIGGFSLGQAFPNLEYFKDGKSAGGRLFGVIERRSQIDPDAPGEKLVTISGALELQDVCFAYPARLDKPILKNFSLKIAPATTVALVGESGGGKSTIIQLLERFYDPQQGIVLLDGADIKTLQLSWLRSQFGLVSQEPLLFATTIKENILFGKPGATQEELEAATTAANAHNFISALPLRYDTHVGEKGLQMSGGQKQRIAIARAILRNPKVLLLDEATSALDAESERVVQRALDGLTEGRTTVVVAHRLSTVKNATSIAVVYGGQLVELGSHDELMTLSGRYANLVQTQHRVEEKESDIDNPPSGGDIDNGEDMKVRFSEDFPDEVISERRSSMLNTVTKGVLNVVSNSSSGISMRNFILLLPSAKKVSTSIT